MRAIWLNSVRLKRDSLLTKKHPAFTYLFLSPQSISGEEQQTWNGSIQPFVLTNQSLWKSQIYLRRNVFWTKKIPVTFPHHGGESIMTKYLFWSCFSSAVRMRATESTHWGAVTFLKSLNSHFRSSRFYINIAGKDVWTSWLWIDE